MITIFQDTPGNTHAELLERCYRMRHNLFVDHLGWNELKREDEREIDEFDSPDAIHICCQLDGKIVGYTRLLPTTKPHLLDSIYPQIMNDKPVPSGPDIYEWTRCTVLPDKQEGAKAFSHPTRLLYLGIVEYCLLTGITALTVEYHPFLLPRQLEIGFDANPLALPSEVNGMTIVPVYAGVTEATLQTMRTMFEIDHSVIQSISSELFEERRQQIGAA